jgi:phosphoenolpyruvate carboxykinase (GTP)
MSSERTAAAAGTVGELRYDPFAMLPFCGYNMADYFAHWLEIGRREGAELPRVYCVNWFRKDQHGNFLWPGFGDNSRVLAWIVRRCEGRAGGVETPIGIVPDTGALELDGLDISPEAVEELVSVDADALRTELPQMRDHLEQFGDRLPQELRDELEGLVSRLE